MVAWLAMGRPPNQRVVLVTGASSGLGLAAAVHLARQGYTVFAGARNVDVFAESALPEGLLPVALDVTSALSVAAAFESIRDTCPSEGLWGLVNNAGICVAGPLEAVPLSSLREQFETNVVGQVCVIQAALPLLRVSRGRIVNVTSGLGRVALPFLGAYAASQFAKEALSDSLRRELAPDAISVSVVEPGAIATPIWGKTERLGLAILNAAPADVQQRYRAQFQALLAKQEAAANRSTIKDTDFAELIESILSCPSPRPRYTLGVDARAASLAARVLPDGLLDRLLSRK